MKLHGRHIPVNKARKELAGLLIGFMEMHDLTDLEWATLFYEETQCHLKSALKSERKKEKK